MEQWKSIKGFSNYEISNKGRVRSITRIVPHSQKGTMKLRGKLLRMRWHKLGKCYFLDVTGEETRKTIYPHKEVAKAFIRNSNPSEKTKVIHLDNNPRNNAVDNLKWVTPSEHMKWQFDVGNKDNRVAWKTRKKKYGNGFKPGTKLGRPPKKKNLDAA